ncbi:MAG: OmpA family protein [Roseiarcus sp.]
MHKSWLPVFGALVGFVALSPAHADPAYNSNTVIDLFSKEKALHKLGSSRQVCFGSDCNAPAPAAAPVKFDLIVTFEFNSDKLTSAARENLAQFGKALLDPRLKGSKFEIDGYTDASGGETYNLGLSDRRADAVVDYLASRGVERATLTAKGWGKAKPRVADPFSPENRRVETHMID